MANDRRFLTAVAIVLLAVSTAAYADEYKGRRLADALRALQARGLRIVFSSATVTPDLRVVAEPRATGARQQLDELLAPHGLVARDGPGRTIEIVRDRPNTNQPTLTASGGIQGEAIDLFSGLRLRDVLIRLEDGRIDARSDAAGRFALRRVPPGTHVLVASAHGYEPTTQTVRVLPGTIATLSVGLLPVPGTHREYISVIRATPYRTDQGVASEMRLDRAEWSRMYGTLSDNPISALHAFPRVAAVDDFRSEFVVRGSAFRHVDVVIDGVSAHWLQHTSYGRGATSSLPMFAGQILEEATLRAGAYPRRYGDRLGPQLDLTIREGSRSRFLLRGIVGGSNGTIVGEGPLGRAGRGSWLAAARQSYIEWPTERAESGRTLFGFSDGVAKFVYDVRPTQQVTLNVMAGTSSVDGDDNPEPNGLGPGRNRAAAANLLWQSRVGASLLLRQRAYILRHHFANDHLGGSPSERGLNEEIVYRADLSRAFGRGLLEGGAQVVRTAIDDRRDEGTDSTSPSSWSRSAYAHLSWAATPTLTISPGVRVTASTLLPDRAVSRWVLGEWVFRRGWSINGSAGVSEQLPDVRHVRGERGSLTLRPERASYADAGVEQHVTASLRWQATVYSRSQRDILREPDVYPRLIGDSLVLPDDQRYASALRGTSRGIELIVDRRSTAGLSGWVSYSYGRTRDADIERRESYWADHDQRHSLNVFAQYRLSPRSGIGATFRTGSGFPIPAYVITRDGGLFAGSARNQVRMRPYARLDVRADRQFVYLGRQMTLFAEVLNALNRANVNLASGRVDWSTGEATGFTDTLFRRRLTGGLMIEF